MNKSVISRRDALRVLAGGVAGAALAEASYAGERRVGEILIRGGRIVNADAVRDADVRIIDQTITEIGARLQPGATARVIDASGKLIMPGGIDPHTHLQPAFVDDLTSGSMAAITGGITTVGTFAGTRQGETILDALDRLSGVVRAEAIADVILHATTWPPSPELRAFIPMLVQRAQPSFRAPAPRCTSCICPRSERSTRVAARGSAKRPSTWKLDRCICT